MDIQGHTVNTLEAAYGKEGQWKWGRKMKGGNNQFFLKRERALHGQVMVVSHKQKSMIILNIVYLRSKKDNKNSRRGKHLARLVRKPTYIWEKSYILVLSWSNFPLLLPLTLTLGQGYLVLLPHFLAVWHTTLSSCLTQGRKSRGS